MKSKHIGTKFFLAVTSALNTFWTFSAHAELSPYFTKKLLENQKIQSVLSEIDALEERKKASLSPFVPHLSVTAGINRSSTENLSTSSMQSLSNYSTQLSANQNIFNGFQDVKARNGLDINLESKKIDLMLTKAEASFNFLNRLSEIKDLKTKNQVHREILERRRKTLKLVELHYLSGLENKGALLLTEANVKQAELDLWTDNENEKIKMKSLNRFLNVEKSNETEVLSELKSNDIQNMGLKCESDAKSHPKILKLEADRKLIENQIDQTKSAFYPSIDANAYIGKTGESFFPNQDRYGLGLSLTWAFFSGGKTFFETRSLSYTRMAKESEIQKTEIEIEEDLDEKAFQVNRTLKQIDIRKDFLNAINIRANIANQKYSVGLLGFESLDIIESDWIQAQQQLVEAESNYHLALINCYYAMGRSVIP